MAWPAARADARPQALTFDVADGRVTLDARDVPIALILERWARLERITIVNLDTLADARVTLRLEAVEARDALATLLRGAGGYILGRRSRAAGDGTEIDRILIVPPSTPTTSVATQRLVRGPARAADTPAAVTGPEGGIETVDQPDVVAAESAEAPSTVAPTGARQDGAAAIAASTIPGLTPEQVAALPPRPPGVVITKNDPPPTPTDISRYKMPKPMPEPPSQAVAPNPFGVTRGATQPGTVSPPKK